MLASCYAEADDGLRELTARWRTLARTEGMEALFEQCLHAVFSPAYVAGNRAEMDRLKMFFRLTMHDPDSFCQHSLAGVSYDTGPVLAKVQSPALVLHGAGDQVIGPHQAARLTDGLPDARLAQIEAGSHFLSWESADAFNDAVLSFPRDQRDLARESADRSGYPS